ncbi:hypothetical protein [Pedobacter suwonensis]|uniref:hypothetical protein n=1 Tax=Pedobacter suwonensis TaxID=332999 RepID=UPI0036C2D5AD
MIHAICTLLPASQISAGKSTEIFALPLITPQPKAGSKRARGIQSQGKSLDAAAIKISVGFYKEGCKPWVFVSFGPSQKKEPFGGGEPRQDCAKGKKIFDCHSERSEEPVGSAKQIFQSKDPSYLRMTGTKKDNENVP